MYKIDMGGAGGSKNRSLRHTPYWGRSKSSAAAPREAKTKMIVGGVQKSCSKKVFKKCSHLVQKTYVLPIIKFFLMTDTKYFHHSTNLIDQMSRSLQNCGNKCSSIDNVSDY